MPKRVLISWGISVVIACTISGLLLRNQPAYVPFFVGFGMAIIGIVVGTIWDYYGRIKK